MSTTVRYQPPSPSPLSLHCVVCFQRAAWVPADLVEPDGHMAPAWDGEAWCDEHRPMEVAS